MLFTTALKLDMAKMMQPPAFELDAVESYVYSYTETNEYGYTYDKSFYLYAKKISNKYCNFLWIDGNTCLFDTEYNLKNVLPSPFCEKLKKGFVYTLHSDFGYKIGSTKNLRKRIDFFKIKLPFKWHCDLLVSLYEYKEYEKFLLKYYKDYNINGEWFDLTESDMDNIRKMKTSFKDELLF